MSSQDLGEMPSWNDEARHGNLGAQAHREPRQKNVVHSQVRAGLCDRSRWERGARVSKVVAYQRESVERRPHGEEDEKRLNKVDGERVEVVVSKVADDEAGAHGGETDRKSNHEPPAMPPEDFERIESA